MIEKKQAIMLFVDCFSAYLARPPRGRCPGRSFSLRPRPDSFKASRVCLDDDPRGAFFFSDPFARSFDNGV